MGDLARDLLSQGLDLCVRARNLDAIDRRSAHLAVSVAPDQWVASGQFDRFVERSNADPHNQHKQIHTRSGTIPLWVQDQYERDLAEWEAKARLFLTVTKYIEDQS